MDKEALYREALAQAQKAAADRQFTGYGDQAGFAMGGLSAMSNIPEQVTLADVADRLAGIEIRLEGIDNALNGPSPRQGQMNDAATPAAPEGIVDAARAALARLSAAETRIMSILDRIEAGVSALYHL